MPIKLIISRFRSWQSAIIRWMIGLTKKSLFIVAKGATADMMIPATRKVG